MALVLIQTTYKISKHISEHLTDTICFIKCIVKYMCSLQENYKLMAFQTLYINYTEIKHLSHIKKYKTICDNM